MLKTFSRYNSSRRGITLVEVVAGMTLLASLATGVLLAFGAHQKQLRRAEQRIDAVQVADQLVGRWYAGKGIPRNTSGRVLFKQEPWIWNTRTIDRSAVGSLPVEKLRIEIYREMNRQDRRASAFVELLAPINDSERP